jgi:nitrogen fixation protein
MFVFSYGFYSNYEQRKSVENRISTMNNFLFSTEQDLSRHLYISGYRTIFLMEKKIFDSGQPISNLASLFNETFFSGTFEGGSSEFFVGETMSEIESSINDAASSVGVNITISEPVINVSQTDPWNVKISLDYHLTMNDKGNLAHWDKNASTSAYIPITSFDDPLYTIKTNRLITKQITRTLFSNFISGADVSNLSSHLTNSYYKESTNAPSFLNRLQGDYTSSLYGIESLVNLQTLISQGITVYDKTVIDYIYFSINNPTPTCTHTGMPSWFKIDSANTAAYNFSC